MTDQPGNVDIHTVAENLDKLHHLYGGLMDLYQAQTAVLEDHQRQLKALWEFNKALIEQSTFKGDQMEVMRIVDKSDG